MSITLKYAKISKNTANKMKYKIKKASHIFV